MANERVVASDVTAIIQTNLTDLEPFIIAANLIVNEQLADKGLSDDTLREIERWLAAHFVSIRDRVKKSEKIGPAAEDYSLGKIGEGLKATPHGQQVLLLDTSGTLAQLGKKRVMFKVDDFREAT